MNKNALIKLPWEEKVCK